MKRRKARLYWAWIHHGSRAIDPESLSTYKKDVIDVYQRPDWTGMRGKVVRVSVRIVS